MDKMAFSRLQYLPIFMSSWFLMSFILTYVISVWQKDVEPIFPYISDTGTFAPTSCIFGQLMNTGNILLVLCVYIRYLQIKDCEKRSSKGITGMNKACLILGWLAALGVGIVGNFQETEVFIVHIIGAVMVFGLGAIYQFIQWRISLRTMKECRVGQALVNFRLVLAIVSATTIFICFSFALLAIMKYTGTDVTKWKKSDGGYSLHLVSTISEWICGLATMTYLFTFSMDFKHFTVSEPTIVLLN